MKNIIILFITIVAISCRSGNKDINITSDPEKRKGGQNSMLVSLSEAQIKNAGIMTGTAEKRNISSILKVSGKIDVPPQNIVSVSFPLGGYLKTTDLLPGTQVKKGEVLGVLEDPQYIQLQQDYLSAKIKCDQLQKEYTRQQELNASNASSDKVLEQVTSDYKTQKVLAKSLGQKLALIGINPEKINEDNISKSVNIYSPINGFVSKVDVNIGKYVSPTDVLFELINPEDIHLTLSVFQKDISLLTIGQHVITYTANNPETKYEAHIILISRNVTPDGSVEVHCHFKHHDKTLIPGMFVNAEIETHASDAVTVPEDAVVMYDKKQYIFVVRGNNQFQMMEVQTGTIENGSIVVMSDNNPVLLKQHIVLKNAYALLMKMKNTDEE
ncbi:MAG: efflux RND transporter periplasmic adaptor subunit [Chitinophagales bacterium]